MKTYLKHKIQDVLDIRNLTAAEYLDFEGKYQSYVEKHDFWELCFAERGSFSLFIDGKETHLKKNELILIPPNKMHSYMSIDGNASRGFVACFECPSVALKPIGEMPFSLDARLTALFKEIIFEYEHTFYTDEKDQLAVLGTPNLGGQQAMIILTEYLLISLLRRVTTQGNSKIVLLNETSFYRNLVSEIQVFLRENVHRRLSLKEICDHFNYSSSFLCKTFKQEAGETIFSHFISLKTEEAKRLLRKSDLSLKEISASLGFSDVKYFSTTFRKATGLSPSDYREERK